MKSLLIASGALAILASGATASAAPSQVHLSWQGSTETTMTVIWRSGSSSGEVQYGLTGSYGKSVKASSRKYSSSYLHQAQVSGLQPGKTYQYRCGVGGDWSPGRAFTTVAKGAVNYRFAVHGDSRSDNTSRGKVRALMQTRKPAFSLHTGDFVSTGSSQSQWDTFFKTMEPLYAWSPMMGALGNHENLAQIYFDQLAFPPYAPQVTGLKNELFYSFDYGSTHVISLSTEHSPSPTDQQAVWLKKDLSKAAKNPAIRFIVAYAHRPPYSSGPHGNNTAGQKAWNHLFESFGVDVTFWGHDHTYERTKPMFQGSPVKQGGVTYIVTGGAGAPLYTAKGASFTAAVKAFYHFVEVNVQGNQMKLDTRGLDGKVFDTLTINKPGPKAKWIMDGALDPGAKKLAGNGSGDLGSLHAGFDGRYLYVATRGAPAVGDHFVLLAANKPSGALVPAPWNKAGKTWARQALLTMESTSAWSNWQDPNSGSGAIPYGSVWKYHDQGKDLGTAWLGASYNASAWKSGPGQLGFGDGDEKTKLYNASPNYPSTYFRRTFTLGKVPAAAKLTVLADDGVAVWINGQQVMSRRMSNGTSYKAWASSTSSDNEVTVVDVNQASGGPFKAGTNVICAMVKQVSGTSSDLSFDLKLESAPAEQTGFSRAANPAETVMEGIIDIKKRFGSVPNQVYLAAAAYGTNSNGGLMEQLPKGNGDGAIGLGEWVVFQLKTPPKPDMGVPKPDAKVQPGKDAKVQPGKDAKVQPGKDIKVQPGKDIKVQPGKDIKTQPGVDKGTGGQPGAEADGGCSVGGAGRQGAWLLLLAALLLCTLRRRR